MKDALAAHAKALGFDVCRVARCEAPPHAREFEAWLDDGRAGEMAWMERNKERRMDPQNVLPGAKSLIVLAMNYWQGEQDPSGSSFPRIARYAWGDDYHDLIEKKLDALNEFLKKQGGLQK